MTYEYECISCKFLWEEEKKITDPPTKTCPKCGKEKAKRLVSGGTAFVLKGGGWANNGYR